MTRKSTNIARAILVDGEPTADVAKRAGEDRRNAHFWAKQIYDAVMPPGWVSEVVTLPRDKMAAVLELQSLERSKLKEDSRQAASQG
jgi:hypothetical protein